VLALLAAAPALLVIVLSAPAEAHTGDVAPSATPAPSAAATPSAAAPTSKTPASTTTAPTSTSGPPAPASPASPTAGTTQAPPPATCELVVRAGDTLWDLAADRLPDGSADGVVGHEWRAWYGANADRLGEDPDLIRPGQVLVLPCA
jgi:nucleoid-associated protein YgaU